MLLIFLAFVCVVLLCVLTFCRICVICVRLRIVVSNTYCVVFLCFVCLRLVYPMLQCRWIVHSWLPLRFLLTFIFVLFLVYQVLPVALDCPILITSSVFSNVYFHPAGVASVSGLSILDCRFGFLYHLFSSRVLCTRCCQCLWIVQSWFPLRCSLTFIFVLCVVYPVLPVSLDCSFIITPSVFSNHHY